MRPSLSNQNGQMLIQVMIAAVVSGIVMSGMMTMMNSQNKSMATVSQKMAANDLQMLMSSAINSGGACKSVIDVLGGAATFSSAAVNPNTPPTIPIVNLPMSSKPGAPILIQNDSQPSPTMAPLLVVKQIQLAILEGSGTQFRGEIQAVFDGTKLNMPIRPASVGVILETTGGANPVITACNPVGAAGPNDPGTPCKIPGETTVRGTVVYSWSGGGKFCCMMDPTTTNISYGAYSNGGFGTYILACKGI